MNDINLGSRLRISERVYRVSSLALALILTGLSFLPFEIMRSGINLFSEDGSADSFNQSVYEWLTWITRILALFGLAGSTLISKHATLLIGLVNHLVCATSKFYRDLSRYFKSEFGSLPWTLSSCFVLILLFGIFVRLRYLGQPIRYDEAFTYIQYATKPLYLSLSDYSYPNNHLFHTLLVHIITQLGGVTPWAIRIPAFTAGIALIPATYLAITDYYDRYVGLLTACLVSLSSLLIEYSTNARGYTIIALIFILLLKLHCYLIHTNNLLGWLLYIAFLTIGFYTIPIMLYPFAVLTSIFWFSAAAQPLFKCKQLLRSWLVSTAASGTLTVLLYTPVVVTSGIKTLVANRFVTALSWDQFTTRIFPSLSVLWDLWHRDIPNFLCPVLVGGLVIALFRKRHTTSKRGPLAIATVVGVVPVVLIQRVVPFPRVWLFLYPLYIAMSASGILFIVRFVTRLVRLKSRHFDLFVSLLVCVLSLLLATSVIKHGSILRSLETGTLRDAKAISVLLIDKLRSTDKVVALTPSDAPLMYYFSTYNVAMNRVSLDAKDAQCVYLVVNKDHQQTFEEIALVSGISASSIVSQNLVASFDSADVYVVHLRENK